ncbi:MAG: hypothetical protein GY940_46750, partial [bacterium]|nr:hypothetical protein [bacterium]
SVNWDAWQEVGMAAAARDKYYGKEIYSRELRLNTQWMLAEHTIDGKGVLPGTAYLDMVVSLLEKYAKKKNKIIELRAVNFLNPLVIAEPEEREVHIILEKHKQADTFDFNIVSRLKTAPREDKEQWDGHTSGKALLLEPEPAKKYEIEEIRENCDQEEIILTADEPGNPARQQGIVRYGPRWNNRERVKFGDRRGLLLQQLPGQFSGDLKSHTLHPALLDRATSFPMLKLKHKTP